MPLDCYLLKLFCHGSKRELLTYVKLVIEFTSILEFSPYFEVMHESTTSNLTKG